MSRPGHSRRFDRRPVTSGLPDQRTFAGCAGTNLADPGVGFGGLPHQRDLSASLAHIG
jgi:hypothetical protein